VVQVTRHIANKSSIDDLQTSVVFAQTEHVTSEMEFLLSDVSHSLTDHFSDVLHHNRPFFGGRTNEQAQSVDFRWRDINFISGLSHDKVLFLLCRTAEIFEIFLDVFKSDEGDHFWLDHVLLAILIVAFFEVEKLLLCDIVLIGVLSVLMLDLVTEISLSFPAIFVVNSHHLAFAVLPI
jgi:hypothetical protein